MCRIGRMCCYVLNYIDKFYIIRPQVETTENIGKLISINVETGEYEIGDDLLVTSRRLQAKQADAAIWAERIGYDAVYTVGGSLIRSIQ